MKRCLRREGETQICFSCFFLSKHGHTNDLRIFSREYLKQAWKASLCWFGQADRRDLKKLGYEQAGEVGSPEQHVTELGSTSMRQMRATGRPANSPDPPGFRCFSFLFFLFFYIDSRMFHHTSLSRTSSHVPAFTRPLWIIMPNQTSSDYHFQQKNALCSGE